MYDSAVESLIDSLFPSHSALISTQFSLQFSSELPKIRAMTRAYVQHAVNEMKNRRFPNELGALFKLWRVMIVRQEVIRFTDLTGNWKPLSAPPKLFSIDSSMKREIAELDIISRRPLEGHEDELLTVFGFTKFAFGYTSIVKCVNRAQTNADGFYPTDEYQQPWFGHSIGLLARYAPATHGGDQVLATLDAVYVMSLILAQTRYGRLMKLPCRLDLKVESMLDVVECHISRALPAIAIQGSLHIPSTCLSRYLLSDYSIGMASPSAAASKGTLAVAALWKRSLKNKDYSFSDKIILRLRYFGREIRDRAINDNVNQNSFESINIRIQIDRLIVILFTVFFNLIRAPYFRPTSLHSLCESIHDLGTFSYNFQSIIEGFISIQNVGQLEDLASQFNSILDSRSDALRSIMLAPDSDKQPFRVKLCNNLFSVAERLTVAKRLWQLRNVFRSATNPQASWNAGRSKPVHSAEHATVHTTALLPSPTTPLEVSGHYAEDQESALSESEHVSEQQPETLHAEVEVDVDEYETFDKMAEYDFSKAVNEEDDNHEDETEQEQQEQEEEDENEAEEEEEGSEEKATQYPSANGLRTVVDDNAAISSIQERVGQGQEEAGDAEIMQNGVDQWSSYHMMLHAYISRKTLHRPVHVMDRSHPFCEICNLMFISGQDFQSHVVSEQHMGTYYMQQQYLDYFCKYVCPVYVYLQEVHYKLEACCAFFESDVRFRQSIWQLLMGVEHQKQLFEACVFDIESTCQWGAIPQLEAATNDLQSMLNNVLYQLMTPFYPFLSAELKHIVYQTCIPSPAAAVVSNGQEIYEHSQQQPTTDLHSQLHDTDETRRDREQDSENEDDEEERLTKKMEWRKKATGGRRNTPRKDAQAGGTNGRREGRTSAKHSNSKKHVPTGGRKR
eukprot:GILK01013416.1.p1 GENE.GILK01013416.1~~GILK01013416.1.p1  ORF type:complete len:1011 (+),score=196.84 GILK01013416.1:325-3033(+)